MVLLHPAGRMIGVCCSHGCMLYQCQLNVAGTHQLTLLRPHRLRLLSNCSPALLAPLPGAR